MRTKSLGGKFSQKLVRRPDPLVLLSWSCCLHLPGAARCGPGSREARGEGWRLRSQGAGSPRGDRKPGHRGLSLAAAALPQPGRKFCLVRSAGASLARLLNRKPGSAGAGGGGERAPDAEPTRSPPGQAEARLASGHPEVLRPGQTGRGGGSGAAGAGPRPGAPRAGSSSNRVGTGAAGAREDAARDGPLPAGHGGRGVGGGGEGRPPSGDRRGPGPGPQRRPGRWRRCDSRRRAPPGDRSVLSLPGSSPLPAFLPSSSLPQGKEPRPGCHPHPSQALRSGGRPCANPLRGFPAPLSRRERVGKGGARARSAGDPAAKARSW